MARIAGTNGMGSTEIVISKNYDRENSVGVSIGQSSTQGISAFVAVKDASFFNSPPNKELIVKYDEKVQALIMLHEESLLSLTKEFIDETMGLSDGK